MHARTYKSTYTRTHTQTQAHTGYSVSGDTYSTSVTHHHSSPGTTGEGHHHIMGQQLSSIPTAIIKQSL